MQRRNSIQFLGLPGSGKTTRIQELITRFPGTYVVPPKLSKIQRVWFFLVFTFRFPVLNFRLLAFLFSNPWKLWRYLLHLYSYSVAVHMYALAHPSQFFIIDEGIFQRVLSVAPRQLSYSQIQSISQLIPRVFGVVVVMNGGSFSRFVAEPDKMTNPRNQMGVAYFDTWVAAVTANFSLLEESVLKNSRGVRGTGLTTDELHAALQRYM